MRHCSMSQLATSITTGEFSVPGCTRVVQSESILCVYIKSVGYMTVLTFLLW